MSIEAMATVLNHSQAKGTAKLVLFGIASHEGDGGAWPTRATLARYASCSESQVKRICRDLVALGELSIELQEGGGRSTDPRYRPNRYRVLVSCPPTCDGSTMHRDSGGASTRPLADSGGASSAAQGAHPEPSGGAPMRPESLVLQTSIEPFVKDLSLVADFDAFYAAYPRKVGKPAARAKYRAARNQTDAAKIRWGLARWRDFWTADKTDVGFIPHPATWLHQERWNDTPPPVTAATASSNIAKFEAAVAARKSTTTKEITA